MTEVKATLRPHAEVAYADELQLLQQLDDKTRPTGWQMSPQAVVTYILGGTLSDGSVITPKYFGQRRLIEVAVATLVTDRALLLSGIPGTAKTWVSEHLAAAISGNSTLLIQGTAGLNEDALRYGWNYAQLLAKGPSKDAIVPSPIMKAMISGSIVRLEELTRIPSDVQDALITILSEKILPVPELNTEIQAIKGFNLIATANDRDKGVNDLSSALQRRFNTVNLPLPASLEEEIKIVTTRVQATQQELTSTPQTLPSKEVHRLVTIFRELRNGKTEDNRTRLKSPGSTLSTAEAISVINNGQALATYFGDGTIRAEDLAASLSGAIIKDSKQDQIVWEEYLETVIRQRENWTDLYEACKALLP